MALGFSCWQNTLATPAQPIPGSSDVGGMVVCTAGYSIFQERSRKIVFDHSDSHDWLCMGIH